MKTYNNFNEMFNANSSKQVPVMNEVEEVSKGNYFVDNVLRCAFSVGYYNDKTYEQGLGLSPSKDNITYFINIGVRPVYHIDADILKADSFFETYTHPKVVDYEPVIRGGGEGWLELAPNTTYDEAVEVCRDVANKFSAVAPTLTCYGKVR